MNNVMVDSFILVPSKPLTKGHTQKLWKTRFLHATGKEEEDLDTQKLQSELDEMMQQPSMFASFDADSLDDSNLPIPLFTSAIILIGSLVWTYYLFDIGINGFPGDIPDLTN
jgi:hypothetical protein